MKTQRTNPGANWHIPVAPIVLLAFTLALIALIVIVRDAVDPLLRAERQVATVRQLQLDSQLPVLNLIVAAAWKIVPVLCVVGPLAVGLMIAWRRWGAKESVWADKVIKMQQVATPTYPELRTLSMHSPARGGQVKAPELAKTVTDQAVIPTFAQLLDQRRVGVGNPLLLGFDADTGGEIAGSWLDLYSTAIAGMSGTGKTTSQRFLACQTAMFGAKFAVVDPHAGAGGDSLASTLAPLEAAFLCEPAADDHQILDVVRLVSEIGLRRVQGRDKELTPIVLWVDELTALLGRSSVSEELASLLERVAQEYRKRRVYVCASGQIWTAARTSSELRDSFASVLCHRMKRAQARLLLPTDEAGKVERLEVGKAVLWRTSGDTQMLAIPNTTADDCRLVAGLLTDNHATMERLEDRPMSNQVVAVQEQALAPLVSAEAARSIEMFKAGMSPAAIVLELRGIRSNEGKRYQLALDEVLTLMREGLK